MRHFTTSTKSPFGDLGHYELARECMRLGNELHEKRTRSPDERADLAIEVALLLFACASTLGHVSEPALDDLNLGEPRSLWLQRWYAREVKALRGTVRNRAMLQAFGTRDHRALGDTVMATLRNAAQNSDADLNQFLSALDQFEPEK